MPRPWTRRPPALREASPEATTAAGSLGARAVRCYLFPMRKLLPLFAFVSVAGVLASFEGCTCNAGVNQVPSQTGNNPATAVTGAPTGASGTAVTDPTAVGTTAPTGPTAAAIPGAVTGTQAGKPDTALAPPTGPAAGGAAQGWPGRRAAPCRRPPRRAPARREAAP